MPLSGTGVNPTGNLAAGRPVTATSTNQGYGPGNTVDGNASSYWESANNAFPQSLTVDLGVAVTVNRAVLKLPPGWGTRNQTLSVLGSTDGTAYSTVLGSASYTFNPASANTVTLNLPAGTRRYLRLTFTGNTGWPAAQLSEFEVYAGGGTGAPALTVSPGTLSFGSRTVGSPSPASAVTVTNTGTAAANLTGVSVDRGLRAVQQLRVDPGGGSVLHGQRDVHAHRDRGPYGHPVGGVERAGQPAHGGAVGHRHRHQRQPGGGPTGHRDQHQPGVRAPATRSTATRRATGRAPTTRSRSR